MDNQQREEAKRELLDRAGRLENMVNSPGWEDAKAYIQNVIQAFANESIMTGFKTMEEFNLARGEVNGLRKFIGEIDEAVKTLHEFRQAQADK